MELRYTEVDVAETMRTPEATAIRLHVAERELGRLSGFLISHFPKKIANRPFGKGYHAVDEAIRLLIEYQEHLADSENVEPLDTTE